MAINILELFATLAMDASNFDASLVQAQRQADKFKINIEKIMSAIGKATAIGLGAAATGVGAMIKQATSAYGEYEQLVGGVNKLFGEASSTVLENADKAFKETGMNANQYLQQVTSFSASLIQSAGRGTQVDLDELKKAQKAELQETKKNLKEQYNEQKKYWNDKIKASKKAKDGQVEILEQQRDETLKILQASNDEQLAMLEQQNKKILKETERANNSSVTSTESLSKAAELANVAMKAISDNVNTFGSDMASVQNAFQGFAKQNFTMLDNLKLGYGGTKEEMIRLISDANEYAESIGEAGDMTISSFADIVRAIDLIQKQQKIAGTTQKEAATTLQGSLAMTKAAWDNLLTGMADPNADFGKLMDNLIESGSAALGNITPIVEIAFKSLGNFISKAAPTISKELPKLVKLLLPDLINTAYDLLVGLADALPGLFPVLIDTAWQLFNEITDKISEKFPALEPVFDVLKSALSLIATVAESAGNGLKTIWDNFLSKVVGVTWDIFSGFLKGLADVLDRISKNKTAVDTLVTIVGSILGIVAAAKTLIGVITLVKTAIEAVSVAGGIANAVFAANPIGLIIVAIGAVIAVIVEVITYWDYLVLIWEESGKQWKKWLGDIGKWFSDTWNSIVDGYWWFIDKITVGAQIIINLWQEGCRQIGDFFVGLWNGIVKTFQNIGQWFRDRFTEAWNGIKNAFSKVGEFFGGIWNSIVSTFSTIGIKVADAIGGAFKAAINGVIWTVEGALNLIPNAINGMISTINKLPGVSISAIPTVALPRLAKGGVLKKGQMAFLEGQGDEAVIPLSQNTEWIDKVAEKLSEKRQSVYYNLEIHIDKMGQTSEDDIEQFADRLMEVMNEKETRRRYVMA